MKSRKRISQMSENRRAQTILYMKARNEFLKANPRCAVYPATKATEIHHKFGRAGKLMMDERYWIPVSREGHDKIHRNIEWARESGFIAPKGQWNTRQEIQDD